MDFRRSALSRCARTAKLISALMLSAGALTLTTACGAPSRTASSDSITDHQAVMKTAIEAALDNPARFEGDSASDGRRKPAKVLEFAHIMPGNRVFELESGGGYWTELFSHIVGANGTVVMQNPQGFLAFVGDEIEARLAGDRLANVSQSISNFDILDAEDASQDVVTWILGPHELFFVPPNGEMLGDPDTSFSEAYRILKPGGYFLVIDHSAKSGAPSATGNDLHRIDKAIVHRLAKSAGFELHGEADFLSNPKDSLDKGVFDPSISGYTDQFVLRFKKPQEALAQEFDAR